MNVASAALFSGELQATRARYVAAPPRLLCVSCCLDATCWLLFRYCSRTVCAGARQVPLSTLRSASGWTSSRSSWRRGTPGSTR